MKFLSIIFTLLMACLVVGCSSTPTIQTVTVYQDKLVDIPNELLKTCPTTQPPEKTKYINSSSLDREQFLTNYSIKLIKDVRNCNEQLKQIKDLQDKEKKILEKDKS